MTACGGHFECPFGAFLTNDLGHVTQRRCKTGFIVGCLTGDETGSIDSIFGVAAHQFDELTEVSYSCNIESFNQLSFLQILLRHDGALNAVFACIERYGKHAGYGQH